MVVDGVSNDTSSRRQAKLDNQKTPDQLRLEEPRPRCGLRGGAMVRRSERRLHGLLLHVGLEALVAPFGGW